MKIKKILLSALFVGAFTLQNASVACPEFITGRQYKTLKEPDGNVHGYVFLSELRGFDMTPEEVVYHNTVDSHGDKFCGYTYKDMIGQKPSMLTLTPKKNKK